MLKIKNLFFKNPNFTLAIDSLNILKGDFVLLIGTNGSGKTSLLKTISNLLNYRGDIFLEGDNIRSFSKKDFSKKIVSVNNDINYSDILVFEYLKYARFPYTDFLSRYSNDDETIIKKYAKDFNIENLLERELQSLSTGERQRINLAKSFMQEAKVFLLDEPVSNLDMKYKRIIVKYISDFYQNNSDRTFIIATHEPQVFIDAVKHVKILLIDAGNLVDYSFYDKEIFNKNLKQYF